MARLPRDARIETREARRRLQINPEPYWRQVTPGLGVGYLKGVRGGVWRVRAFEAGAYRKDRLGIADDCADADGKQVLSYAQAVAAALDWSNRDETPDRGRHTVKDAVDEYLAKLEAEGKKSIAWTRGSLERDILPDWGLVALQHVTATRINKWIAKLLNAPRKTRGGKDRELDDSSEGQRKRRATAQRKWNVLRAALNVARDRGWTDGSAWAGIKNLKNIDPPEDDFPTTAECQRLIRRVAKEFRPVVEATFLTGAAYRELTSMRVRDYTPSSGHVRVFNSKRRPRYVPLTQDGVSLFDEVTAGKSADDLIFTHKDGRPWKTSEQSRPMLAANAKAKLDPPITLTRLRKAYGSLLLNAGVPLEVVSKAMGHSAPSVTLRHYSRLLQSTIDEQIRGALPSLGRRRKVARLK
jgi:integrase